MSILSSDENVERIMKVVLAILGGLTLSIATFVGGLVLATAFFTAGADKSQLASADSTDLWTNSPRRVDPAKNHLERLPGRAAPAEPAMVATSEPSLPDADHEIAVDAAVTGSIVADTAVTTSDDPGAPQMSEAHLEWCSSRYRSYRPRDNSYTPYSGGRRECRSPFSPNTSIGGVVSTMAEPISPAPAEEDDFPEEARPDVEQVAAVEKPSTYGTWEHAQSCFARFRSYRPEDNTYQPSDGGPRRQCQ